MCGYICIRVYDCMCVSVCVCMYMFVCACACVSACVHIYQCVCACVYTFMYALVPFMCEAIHILFCQQTKDQSGHRL